MLNIKIICVGKLKEKFFADAAGEYIKRIGRYAKLDVVEVSDKSIPDSAGEKQQQQVLAAEADAILAKVPAGAYVVALCVEASQLSSEQFAERLAQCAVDGKSCIAFIIGGSLGLHERVKSRADLRLGFSKMTLPHQLMRVVLLEQVYRAFKILGNETYHK